VTTRIIARIAKRNLWLALVAGGLALPGGFLAAQEEVGIKRGVAAPVVQLEDLDGNPVDLGELIGTTPILLEFWANWCENCEALAPSMERAHREFGDRVEFFAVAVGVGQKPRNVKRHLEGHPASYEFLYDRRGDAVRAYSAPTTSYVVIVDAAGRVAYTGVGRSQDIETAVRQVLQP
jgi:thiol-disulfide isomerase/thioredoxin